MNYSEDLRNLIITEGTYDEDLKMTVFVFKENICAPSLQKRYLSLMVDEDNNILAGTTMSDSVLIETVLENEIPLLYTEVKKEVAHHRPGLMKVTAVVLAMFLIACFAFTLRS